MSDRPLNPVLGSGGSNQTEMNLPSNSREMLATTRRMVVKVGSALLVDPSTRGIRRSWLNGLAKDIGRLREQGSEVVLVSSGAIAIGRQRLGFSQRELTLEESQAAAAVGQVLLSQAWDAALEFQGMTSAQILVTLEDTKDRRRYLNARATMQKLLQLGVVPIVNENDTVATDEIRYGDNDRLAAGVSSMISADRLVLLSDIDGLYTADPQKDPTASHIPWVAELSPEIEAMAGDSANALAKGGMRTKLMAARTAMKSGCAMAIVEGNAMRPLSALIEGANCTWFLASSTPRAARKRWIGAMAPRGCLRVDTGATMALRNGKSLLPAGVVQVEGDFERGDPVSIESSDHEILAIALVGYCSADVAKIAGFQSAEIEGLLGYSGQQEIVHRDDMAL